MIKKRDLTKTKKINFLPFLLPFITWVIFLIEFYPKSRLIRISS